MGYAFELRGATKRYPGFALEDVSLALPRGYCMGLIGPNGAGKTTTLKLILGLVGRTTGALTVLGRDMGKEEIVMKREIGFVQDEPQFYPGLSLTANAKLLAPLYPRWDDQAFTRLAERFQLSLRKRFGQLSRGNKTRFALTVALSHHAELLVMDEPTTGLDPVARRELLEILRECLQDEAKSVIFSTHITTDIERIADYVTLLQQGRVMLSAAKDEIASSWALVKGGLELLDDSAVTLLRGVKRGAYGFVAITDSIEQVRRSFGERVRIDRASLEDLVYHTTPEVEHVDV